MALSSEKTPALPRTDNDSPISPVGRFALGAVISLVVLDLTFVANAMDRQIFPFLLPHIRADLGFGPRQSGLLSTVFGLGLGLAAFPAGYLADRFRRKHVLLFGIGLFSLATLLQATAGGFTGMAVYRVLSGLGEGIQYAALFAVVGGYFHRRRGLALGSINVSYGYGAFLSPVLGAHLLSATRHWQTPLWIYALLGVVLMFGTAIAVPASFTDPATRTGHRPDSGPGNGSGAGPARLLNRNLLCCVALAATTGFCGFSYNGLYPTYLTTVLHFAPDQVGLVSGMSALGSLVGILGGWLADRLNARPVLILALLGAMVTGWSIFNIHSGPLAQAALSLLEGTFISGFIVTTTNVLLQRAAPATALGRASGMFAASYYLPASFSGYVFAALQQHVGWGHAALFQLSLLPLTGLVAVLLLRGEVVRPTVGTGPAAG